MEKRTNRPVPSAPKDGTSGTATLNPTSQAPARCTPSQQENTTTYGHWSRNSEPKFAGALHTGNETADEWAKQAADTPGECNPEWLRFPDSCGRRACRSRNHWRTSNTLSRRPSGARLSNVDPAVAQSKKRLTIIVTRFEDVLNIHNYSIIPKLSSTRK